GERDANRFVGNEVKILGTGKQALEVFASPQQQQIEKTGEDASHQRGKNEWTGREPRRVKALGIERGILSITCAQQKKDQRQRLQKNADEDCAIRHGEENFFFPER